MKDLSLKENTQTIFKDKSPHTVKANIKKIFIQEKLDSLGISVPDICLGDFDYIGEFTARKQRSKDSNSYHSAGAFFRPNYERGILIYHLIKHYKLESMLEIGFGRGYACFCAAKAFSELGRGTITTVDPNLDEKQLQHLMQFFPKDWFDRIKFCKGTSDVFFQDNEELYDFAYIDGDHRYEAVKNDWDNSQKVCKKLVLFDDYELSDKFVQDIEVAGVVNSIEDFEKELIIMDRRIFQDDRNVPDEEMDYGQVLVNMKKR